MTSIAVDCAYVVIQLKLYFLFLYFLFGGTLLSSLMSDWQSLGSQTSLVGLNTEAALLFLLFMLLGLSCSNIYTYSIYREIFVLFTHTIFAYCILLSWLYLHLNKTKMPKPHFVHNLAILINGSQPVGWDYSNGPQIVVKWIIINPFGPPTHNSTLNTTD